jgi:type IV pilus assembly protein PilB
VTFSSRADLFPENSWTRPLNQQRIKGGRLAQWLLKLGYLTEEILQSVLSRQFGLEFVDPPSCEIDPELLKLFPREVAVRLLVIPIRREGNLLFVAMADPIDVGLLDELTFRTGLRVKPMLASEAQIREGIEKHFGSRQKELALRKVFEELPRQNEEVSDDNLQFLDEYTEELDAEALKVQSEEAPIVRLVNFILIDALRNGASYVHVEPFEKELRVRFRIDGVLQSVMSLPVKLKDALASRIKIMSRLNISEKRVPQDGRIRIEQN